MQIDGPEMMDRLQRFRQSTRELHLAWCRYIADLRELETLTGKPDPALFRKAEIAFREMEALEADSMEYYARMMQYIDDITRLIPPQRP